MSSDYFLDIDGIKGESIDATHKDQIQLQTFGWAEAQSGSFASNAGGGAGKVSMQDFHFTMSTNKASPDLMLSCATGKHIAKALLTCRKAGDKQQEFLKVSFTDLLISSYQISGAEVPSENISFNFATVKFEYAPQKADGTLDTPIIRGYDVKQQKKL